MFWIYNNFSKNLIFFTVWTKISREYNLKYAKNFWIYYSNKKKIHIFSSISIFIFILLFLFMCRFLLSVYDWILKKSYFSEYFFFFLIFYEDISGDKFVFLIFNIEIFFPILNHSVFHYATDKQFNDFQLIILIT